MRRHLLVPILALVLVAAACGDEDGGAAETTTTTTTEAPTTTTEPPTTTTTAAPATTTTTTEPAGPVTGPATIAADDQESDGTSIVVASADLPTPGYIAVHADADGSPGPIIGNSSLLPAGTSTDVMVPLDEPIEENQTLWPMLHVDADGDGIYQFSPDNPVDVPATTADGMVAVLPIEITVTDMDMGDEAASVVTATSGDLGTYLTDADGNTLYLFIPDDGSGTSTCTDACADAWPPLPGPAAAEGDAAGDLLGTTTRADGSIQATYNGWPLYYFSGDAAAGDTNGQGINDIWYVVSLEGAAIQ